MYAVRTHRYQPEEPRWRDHRQFGRGLLPAAVRPWLLDTGSLTARLVAASDGAFRVQILSQGWQQPRLSERRLLGMRPGECAIVREVALLCHGEPWVFARSVMPATSLRGRLRHLRRFKDSALGALLFSDPSMRRAPYELALIDGRSPAIPAHLRADGGRWGRRSCFYIDSLPIMVSEIFLPAFRP